MHDSWELLYGLAPTVDDSADDPDGDGLSNYQEYLNRTDPIVHEIVTLEVPLIDLYLSGFSTDGYRGQTFKPNEDITAESLTVHLGSTISTAIDFRILIVEVVETPEFHPTNILYESSTISIPQSFETPPQSVTVDLENITLNAGQTYAWILDGFVAYDGTNKSAPTAINNQNSYTEGYMIDFPPNPLYLGTREEHFADTWMVDMDTDMPFTLEYRPIIGGAL